MPELPGAGQGASGADRDRGRWLGTDECPADGPPSSLRSFFLLPGFFRGKMSVLLSGVVSSRPETVRGGVGPSVLPEHGQPGNPPRFSEKPCKKSALQQTSLTRTVLCTAGGPEPDRWLLPASGSRAVAGTAQAPEPRYERSGSHDAQSGNLRCVSGQSWLEWSAGPPRWNATVVWCVSK